MATKFSEDQIQRFKDAGFSEADIKLFEFDSKYAPSDDVLDALETTKAISDTIKILPKNKEAFIDKIEKNFGDISGDEKKLKQKILELAEHDPEFLEQTAALCAINKYTTNGEQ